MTRKFYGLIVVPLCLIFFTIQGLGAHATFSMRQSHFSPVAVRALDFSVTKSSRVALVIGNSHYPDAAAPLVNPVNDARILQLLLQKAGFETVTLEDADKKNTNDAVNRLTAMVEPGAVVALFYGGYGIQVAEENFMIPVDAKIWSAGDVVRDGVSLEWLLSKLRTAGAGPEIVIIDASRRNPFERRFRDYSHGLSPINAPVNALTITSTSPDEVSEDNSEPNSLLVSSLLSVLQSNSAGVGEAFLGAMLDARIRSGGTQIPSVSSSLLGDIHLE